LVRHWRLPPGGSWGSLSWFLALLLGCCCLAWSAALAGAAWTFFKPKKNKRMVQHHSYEMPGMHAESWQSQQGNQLRAPLSKSSKMSAKQEYDLLTVHVKAVVSDQVLHHWLHHRRRSRRPQPWGQSGHRAFRCFHPCSNCNSFRQCRRSSCSPSMSRRVGYCGHQ